jgi:hypothetical protein
MTKTKRSTLYGYEIVNGIITFNANEMLVVTEIYELYIDKRRSFGEIAAYLNGKKVEYSIGNPTWDKNKIARIIGDRRYIGDKGYMEMIPPEVFEKADRLRQAKQIAECNDKIKNIIFARLKPKIICGVCGGQMYRLHDERKRDKVRWRCQNNDCDAMFVITDADLANRILEIINRFIGGGCRMPICADNTDSDHKADANHDGDDRKLEAEIMRLLNGIELDKEQIKRLIFECAMVKYRGIVDGGAEGELIISYLLSEGPFASLEREVLNKAVRAIELNNDGIIELVLANGWKLGEGAVYGTDYVENTGGNRVQASA